MRASQRAGRRSAQLRRQFSDSVAIPGASKKLQFANKPSKRVINAVRDPFRILKIGAVGAVGAAAAAVVYTQIEHDASSQPVMGAQLQNIFWCKMEDLGVAAFAQAEPYTIESLDAQQLQRILGASGSLGPGTTVRAVSYTLEERGPFRDIYRLHIVYSGGTGPKTVIVKLSPAGSANADRRLRARLAGCYGNEVSFHTSVAEIAEDAGVSLPKVYLALHDPASARMVLIVDDTDKVEESSADLTTEQARVAVDSLAALHSTCWESGTEVGHAFLRRGACVLGGKPAKSATTATTVKDQDPLGRFMATAGILGVSVPPTAHATLQALARAQKAGVWSDAFALQKAAKPLAGAGGAGGAGAGAGAALTEQEDWRGITVTHGNLTKASLLFTAGPQSARTPPPSPLGMQPRSFSHLTQTVLKDMYNTESAWLQNSQEAILSAADNLTITMRKGQPLPAVTSPGSVDVTIRDWKNARGGAGEEDLASLVVSSLPEEARRELEMELLLQYHSKLMQPPNAVTNSYPLYACIFRYQIAVLASVATLMEENLNEPVSAERIERALIAVQDWNCSAALELVIDRLKQGKRGVPSKGEVLAVLPEAPATMIKVWSM